MSYLNIIEEEMCVSQAEYHLFHSKTQLNYLLCIL